LDPLLVGGEHAGDREHRVDHRGLAMVDVRDERDITDGCGGHRLELYGPPVTVPGRAGGTNPRWVIGAYDTQRPTRPGPGELDTRRRRRARRRVGRRIVPRQRRALQPPADPRRERRRPRLRGSGRTSRLSQARRRETNATMSRQPTRNKKRNPAPTNTKTVWTP